jgi:hypothetical protein
LALHTAHVLVDETSATHSFLHMLQVWVTTFFPVGMPFVGPVPYTQVTVSLQAGH